MQENKMKGKYGLTVAFSMVVGIVIGIGIFFKAQPVLVAAGFNPMIAIVAWVVAGAISIIGGLTIAELGASVTESGGIIAWTRKCYGDRAAYLVGWAQAVIYGPGLVAVLAYYFAFFTTMFLDLPQEPQYIFPIALLAVTSTYLSNTYTVKMGGIVQAIATVAKLIPLVAVIVLGFMNGAETHSVFTTPVAADVATSPFALFGGALVAVLFAYDGWIFVGTISAELKNVKRDLPLAIIFGLGFITLVYVVLNIALLNVMPADQLAGENGGVFGVATAALGDKGAKFILLGIMISSYGGLNGFTLISTRVPYALAEKGLFLASDYFSSVSDRFQQPVRSCNLTFAVILLYISGIYFTGNADIFADIPVALFWGFNTALFAGVMVLRKREPNLERPYKVPFYPVIPILAVMGGAGIFVCAMAAHPKYMLISVVVTAVGLVFYSPENVTKAKMKKAA